MKKETDLKEKKPKEDKGKSRKRSKEIDCLCSVCLSHVPISHVAAVIVMGRVWSWGWPSGIYEGLPWNLIKAKATDQRGACCGNVWMAMLSW